MMASTQLVTRRWRGILVMALCFALIPAGVALADHRAPFDGTQHDYGEMVQYDLVFPVAGDYTLRDTFSAARTNGDHHAQDIMADKMVPIVAAASGTIRYINWTRDAEQMYTNGRCCTMVITHDDGWETWYIHMNNDTPGTDDGQGWGIADGLEPGMHVDAGQLIGWVGDSGNAENTPSHLHFELYDPEGVIVNPYEALLAAADPTCDADCYPFVPLELGSRGSRVVDLQTMLDTIGHDPGPIDGIFGQLTRSAVRSYQTAASLPVTGVVDETTWDALVADYEAWTPGTGGTAGLVDAGFESGSVAASPHLFRDEGGTWSIGGSAARSGSFGAIYDSTGQSGMAILMVNGPRARDEHVDVTPGEVVGFSAWVSSDGSTNRIRPRIHFFDASGGYLSGVTQRVVRPGTSWKKIDVAGIAPPGAAIAVFQIRVYDDGDDGQYRFDDLALYGPTGMPAAVVDSGFESGDLAASPHVYRGEGGTWSIGAAAARTGSFGAVFDSTGQTGMAVLMLNGPRSRPEQVDVVPGDVVGFSAWVSSEAGATNRFRPRIHFFDSSGTYLAGVTQGVVWPGTTWQKMEVAGIAPADAAVAVFQVRIHDDESDGLYFVDDVWPQGADVPGPGDGPPQITYDPEQDSEQWRPLVEYVFAMWGLDQEKCGTGDRSGDCVGPQVDNAIIIMECESFGDPTIVNPVSGTTGLFQHRPIYWDARVARVQGHFPDFPGDATPSDPYDNVMVAALLVHESRDALIGENSLTGPWDDGPEPWGHWDGSSRYCADPPLVSP